MSDGYRHKNKRHDNEFTVEKSFLIQIKWSKNVYPLYLLITIN